MCTVLESAHWLAFLLQDFREEVLESMRRERIEALLSPGFPCPAVAVGAPAELPGEGVLPSEVKGVKSVLDAASHTTRFVLRDSSRSWGLTRKSMALHVSSGTTTYTQVFNVLNFPTGSLPVSRVTAEDDAELNATYPTPDMWHRKLKQVQLPLATPRLGQANQDHNGIANETIERKGEMVCCLHVRVCVCMCVCVCVCVCL